MKLVWTLLTLLLAATFASAAWAQNPIPVAIVSGGSLTATTAATASAAPTAVIAGTGKPINESLFSELWVSLSTGGVPISAVNGLAVNCVLGCSGGLADAAAFTAGASAVTTGGVYQTTATANALTDGQFGSVQMTASRSFFTNLRNAAGAEVGLVAAPVFTAPSIGGVAVTGGAANSNSTAPLAAQIMVTDNSALQRVMTPLNITDGTGGNNMLPTGGYAWNGATWDRVKTPLPVVGSGAAGTAATGVVTVQGIAAAVPVLVSPGASSIWGSGVNTGGAIVVPQICGRMATISTSSATDTEIVAVDGTKTTYVCDYEISTNAANNVTLEKSASACGTPVQISQTWYGGATWGKTASNPYYRGITTGSAMQLCVKTTTTAATDITVYYDQY